MELDYWHLNNSIVDSSYGGYESVFYKIKEIIHLEKKSQKALIKLFYSKKPKALLLQTRMDSLERFQLDIMPLRSPGGHRVQYEKWPEIQVNEDQSNFISSREKLRLKGNSKRLLIWLSGLSSPRIPHRFIARCTNQLTRIEKFQLNCRFLIDSTNERSKVKHEYMPSLLGIRFKEALGENILQVASPILNEKFTMEHDFYNTQSLENYIFEVMQTSVAPKLFPKFQKWQEPLICHQNEVIFEILRSQLFKLEFNESEFFKVKANTPDPNRNPKSKLLSGSKIPRLEAWQLEWDPFERIKEITTTNGDPPREAQDLFEIHDFKLQFYPFPYSSLGFISMEEDTSESLQFTSPNHLSPAVIEELSVVHRRQKSLEETINSRVVHKRSSIDDYIQPRKKNRKGDDSCLNMTLSKRRVFHTLNHDMNRCPIIRPNAVPPTLELPRGLEILLEHIQKPRRLLVNAGKMRKNDKIMEYLNSATKLQLVEQELASQCDFVVSATSCIFIARLDLFFQLLPDNTMFYENAFKALLNEFKTVVILMKYPEIMDRADKDIFWKLRLFLQPPAFQLFLVRDLPHEIGKWIDILSNRPQTGQLLDFHPLHLLHFNKFLVQDLLSNHTFEQILSMVNINHTNELSYLITDTQCKRIRKLMALGW